MSAEKSRAPAVPPADYANMQALRESDVFEAKCAQGGLPESLYETVSAFANARGGVIAMGVTEGEDKTLSLTGVAHPRRLLRQARRGIRRRFVNLNMRSLRFCAVRAGGVWLAQITVPRAAVRPVYIGTAATGTYLRVGEADERCTPAQVDRLAGEP